jgi:c-di-GMP-related signal transduction protein
VIALHGTRWFCWRILSRSIFWQPLRENSFGWPKHLLERPSASWPKKSKPTKISSALLGWGYSYFQGYFFSRPQMLSHHDIPACKLNSLRILQAANQNHIDLARIAEQIKSEASMSYRLLRYLNSPLFFLVAEIHSIEHALSLLGERGVRKWVPLVAVACMGDGKPEELMVLPLIRARFCELLAPCAGLANASNDLFLLGLLLAMDAILDMKIADILQEIAIGSEIRDALLGKKNPLREVFNIALLYEAGSWEAID